MESLCFFGIMADPRTTHRYTPYFCEENIWWLAREMSGRGDLAERGLVCLFSNASASIAVLNQRATPPGRVMAWDYHVVLALPQGGSFQVFDLDTRLAFPTSWPDYFRHTFPNQQHLPLRWRSRVRLVPVRSYLDRLCSDRGHMVGRLPREAFPAYPPICPDDRRRSISLADYCDMYRPLDDGSVMVEVSAAMQGPVLAD